MYIYIYIYIAYYMMNIHICLCLSLSLSIYIYIHIYLCTYIYIYIYVYTLYHICICISLSLSLYIYIYISRSPDSPLLTPASCDGCVAERSDSQSWVRKTVAHARSTETIESVWDLLKDISTLLDLCVSSLRRGHPNLLCIVPILTEDVRRESRLSPLDPGVYNI